MIKNLYSPNTTLAGAVVCLVLLLSACGKSEQEQDKGQGAQREGVVKIVDLRDVISNTGTLIPLVKVELQSETSGRIDSIWAQEGAQMVKGDIILTIDPEKLLTQKQTMELEFKKARLQAKLIERDFENSKKLLAFGKVSQKEMEDLENQLDIKKLDITSIQLKLTDINKELENTNIRAPMTGVLTDLLVEEGEIVVSATSGNSAGTKIGTLANISRLEVETEIGEIDYPKIKQGLGVDISMASNPDRRTHGHISFISMAAKKQSDGMVSNFKIKITVDSIIAGMVPGVNVQVDMVVKEKAGVLGVPYAMVNRTPGRGKEKGSSFTVTMAGSKESRKIKVGDTDYKYYEVLSGLEEGDKVVAAGPGSKDKFTRKR